jgi:hypothetical protein
VRTALEEQGRCLELLKSDKARMESITAQIQKLGDPPDAAAGHRKRQAAHADALKVARRVAGLPEKTMFLKVGFYRQPEGWMANLSAVDSKAGATQVGSTLTPMEDRYAYLCGNDFRIQKTRSLYPDIDLTNTYYTDTYSSVGFRYFGSDLLELGEIGVSVELIHAPVMPPDDLGKAKFHDSAPSQVQPVRLAGCPGYELTWDEEVGEIKTDEPPVWKAPSRVYVLDADAASEGYWVVIHASGTGWAPPLSENLSEEKKLWQERLPILRQRFENHLSALLNSLDLDMVEKVPLTEGDRLKTLEAFAAAHPPRDASDEDKARLEDWRRGHWALRLGADPLPTGLSSDIQTGNAGFSILDSGGTVFTHTWTRPPAELKAGARFEFEIVTENTKQRISDSKQIWRQSARTEVDLSNINADGSSQQWVETELAYSDPAQGARRTSAKRMVVMGPPVRGQCTRSIKVSFGPGIYMHREVTYLYDWIWDLNPEDNASVPPSVVPVDQTAQPAVPPPSAEEIAKAEAEKKWKLERIAEIRQNIDFLQKNLALEQEELGRETDTTRRGSYEFRVIGLRSDIQAEEDSIRSLETGMDVHTRSPFDQYASAHFVQECQTEAREASQMVRAVIAANRMASMLPPEEAEKARAFIRNQFTPEAVAAHDVAKARQVLQAEQNTVQGYLEGVAAKSQGDAALAQFGMDAASNIKAAADAGMTVCSAFGGQPINYLYQAGTGYIEGGVVKGLTAAASAWSTKIDYAVTAYEAYEKDGALSAGGAVLLKVAQNTAMEYIAGQFGGHSTAQEPAMPKPTLQEQFDAAKFQQERQWGEALVKDFERSQGELMKAGASGAAPEVIMQLQAAARDKAAAVASSLHAKNYLKYRAEPALGQAYDSHMRAVHADADAGLKESLKERKWNADEMDLIEIRNSSSYGKPNMDRDVGLRERSLWELDDNKVPIIGADGRPVPNPDAWTTGPNGLPTPKPQLTKEGKPMTLNDWRDEAQPLYDAAYRKASGGRSADIAMEEITTTTHPEAYKDLMWLEDNKSLVSQAWAGQAADVTRYKALHILDHGDPTAAYFTKLQEVARGTAKDMESKLMPILKSATPISGESLNPNPLSYEAISQAKAHWGDVQSTLQAFGRNDIDPITATRRIRELTGGKSIPEVVDEMSALMASLVQGRH